MEIKQPYLFNGAVHSTLSGSIAARDGSTETTTPYGFHGHDPGVPMATVAESSLCRSLEKIMEPDSIDASLKKDQSIIDSSDSIPKRLQEPEGEEMISQGNDGPMIIRIAVNENTPVLSEEFLLPSPVHMYSRRKKGKKACPIVIEKDSDDVQSTVPKENVYSHDEQARSLCHPHAVQSSVLNERSKAGLSRGREKQTSCKDHENLNQHKLEKSKFVSSPDKKRRRCAVTTVDNTCKTNGPPELGVAVPVSGGSSEYAAVKAGLQACTATLIEKVRFKDVLKQRDGLQQYLDCSDYSSKFLVLSEGCVLPLCCYNIFWPDDLIGENIRQKLYEASGFRSWRYLGSINSGENNASAVASPNETFQMRLLRDIHDFLNYHGFINVGVASKKPRLSSSIPAGVKSSDCYESRPTEGLATVVKKLADRDLEAQTITSVSPCFVACRRKEAAADQELATAGFEQKKKLRHGIVVHECPDEVVVDTMIIDKKPAVKGLQNNLAEPDLHRQSVYSGREAGSELTTARPSDEEFLLDIKNRIKARNRKKKQYEMSAPLEFKCQEQGKEVRMTKCEDSKVKSKGRESRVQTVEEIPSCNQVSVAVCAHDKQPLRKKVIVVGAGAAGLAAGRHLQNMNIQVTVLEARDRVGGRVFTDRISFSGPVDLGASVVTGVEADLATERRPDPAALLCKQLDLELTVLQGDCPLFDVVMGAKVPADRDKALEAEFNCFLDETAKLVAENESSAMQMSLEEGLKLVYKKHKALAKHDLAGKKLKVDQAGRTETICAARMLFSKESADFSLAQRVMSWHFSNLEHQCGAELNKISLPYWNQDNAYGGFAGPHCMINGGFSAVMEALGADLDIHLDQVVSKIDYTCKDDQSGSVGEIRVQTKGGAAFYADAVLLTVPLGYMKSDLIEYSPPLPDWKIASIQRLGFGLLTKVVMEFPVAFWDETVDSFGCTAELRETRGRCFLFWNLKKTAGFPILSTLVAGKAAVEDEQKEISEVLEHALQVLRKLFGETAVPQPTAFTVTKWGSDPYSRGAYSYVAVGASDEDYDILGQPVENRLFFAGEATCKEHPDTVGGAMMSGLREAVRILDVLHNRADLLSESEALGAADGQSDTQGDEVKEIVKRLTDVGVSSATKRAGGKLGRIKGPLSKASVLQGLFGVPKTNSGRLLLAKEMLQLPDSSLRAFLNTKAGLVILNSWIQGSMGKNGGQLLRLCLQLLLVVGSPLSLAQRSGIELTLKDKVLRHSSRDIRATAGQLLKLWMEATSKGKAARDLASPKHKGKAARDLACPMQNSASCQIKQKKKVKDVKVPSSLAGAVLKDHFYHPSVCGKDLLHGNPERQTEASGCLNTKDSAPEAKEGNVPEPKNFGQALELTTPIVKVEPIAAKATKVAAKAHESTEAAKSKQPELPKILSFQKFAKRDHFDSNKRKPLLRETLILYGKDLVTSGADARQSKVRDWSIDFSDSCSYLGSPRLLAMLDNASSRDGFSAVIPNMPGISSTEIAGERHESGLTSNQDEVLPNSKETTDDASAGSSMRGSHRRQSGVCLASLNSGNMPLNTTPLIEDDKPVKFVSDDHRRSDAQRLGASICNHPSADAEKRESQSHSAERRPDSAEGHCCSLNEVNDASAGSSVRLAAEQRNEILKTKEHFNSHLLLDGEKRSSSMGAFSKPVMLEHENFSSDRSEQVKKAVTEYLAHLLTPLYKTKRINKESFKSIMKKAIAKVMERRTEEEVLMEATEFMDTKRKIKIRSLVDKLVERYLENVHRH